MNTATEPKNIRTEARRMLTLLAVLNAAANLRACPPQAASASAATAPVTVIQSPADLNIPWDRLFFAADEPYVFHHGTK